ncbi:MULTISPECIES: prepilin-type N-terminal cleavage/methylation domain-containing protein [unclassified Microcoleus]|uniref:prepilin-type N-terminal cleavage/methylation domain-containing protein n=1 Tax=unclassified Microcoleus TaxID=2642155 RepID=UPI002FD56D02
MKTPPILLKLLHNSTAKSRPNFHHTASKKNDAGFTLIEVLIIVLILGIFASIAAPSWLGFINRQRVRTVNDRVLQTLRSAQSEAKRNKSDRVVTFLATDPPTVTINGNAQQLNVGGEIKPRQITLLTNKQTATPANSITFDYQGNPAAGTTPFVVTVAPVGGGTKQCVIVQTLLGGMRTDEGINCPPPS